MPGFTSAEEQPDGPGLQSVATSWNGFASGLTPCVTLTSLLVLLKIAIAWQEFTSASFLDNTQEFESSSMFSIFIGT